jgi:hypothetical protein
MAAFYKLWSQIAKALVSFANFYLVIKVLYLWQIQPYINQQNLSTYKWGNTLLVPPLVAVVDLKMNNLLSWV